MPCYQKPKYSQSLCTSRARFIWSNYFKCFTVKRVISISSVSSSNSFQRHNQNPVKHLRWSFLTVCSYHVTYAFQSKSTLYSCLNSKELLAQNRRSIWSLGDCNRTRTHNHLVRKRTLSHLAKWLNVRLRTKWLWVRVPLRSLNGAFCFFLFL